MALTEKQYWSRINDLAEEVAERVREEGQDVDEALHEVVDGTDLVIYTKYYLPILEISPNRNALIDELGIEAGLHDVADFDDIAGHFAYHAVYADVKDTLDENYPELF